MDPVPTRVLSSPGKQVRLPTIACAVVFPTKEAISFHLPIAHPCSLPHTHPPPRFLSGATYSGTPCAGETVFDATPSTADLSGRITSHAPFIGEYGNNANCSWTVIPPANTLVRLEFRTFELSHLDAFTVGCRCFCCLQWLSFLVVRIVGQHVATWSKNSDSTTVHTEIEF